MNLKMFLKEESIGRENPNKGNLALGILKMRYGILAHNKTTGADGV